MWDKELKMIIIHGKWIKTIHVDLKCVKILTLKLKRELYS